MADQIWLTPRAHLQRSRSSPVPDIARLATPDPLLRRSLSGAMTRDLGLRLRVDARRRASDSGERPSGSPRASQGSIARSNRYFRDHYIPGFKSSVYALNADRLGQLYNLKEQHMSHGFLTTSTKRRITSPYIQGTTGISGQPKDRLKTQVVFI